MKITVAAHVSIVKPGEMTANGRRAIARWLRQTAADFEKLGDQYGPKRFDARYWAEGNPR